MRLLKRQVRRRWKAKPCVISKTDFKLASRQYRSAVRCFLVTQEDHLLAAGPCKFFAYAAHQLHPTNNSLLLCSSSGLTSKPTKIVQFLAMNLSRTSIRRSLYRQRFATLAMSSLLQMQITATHHLHPRRLCHELTSVSLMYVWLADSTAGPNGIAATFYKKLAHYLTEPLACLYQSHYTRHECLMYGNRPKSLQSTKARG